MKKQVKEKKENRIKKFFNSPIPIIIFLILLSICLLIKCFDLKDNGTIYAARVEENEIFIENVHIFTSNKVNYFYSSPVTISVDDVNIYNYKIGYYVETDDGLVPLAVRSGNTEKGLKLSTMVSTVSNYNFAELDKNHGYFKKGVKPFLNKLIFKIEASSKLNGEYDINYEYLIDMLNLSKSEG